jgi:hypothetical protein
LEAVHVHENDSNQVLKQIALEIRPQI